MLIEISGVTGGQSPYDVFLCTTANTSCFFISGNTFIPPNIIIDSEDYFPGEDVLLLRLIDTNGCVYNEIQDCLVPPPSPCICKEYKVIWGHPGLITFSYDPCCPSGTNTTTTINFPNTFTFSSSTTPNLIAGFGGIISEIGDLCPCT
jgi:hypothetical protein